MSRSVRLKEHLATEVERLAKEERRSLAQMVELLLEQALRMGVTVADAQPRDVVTRSAAASGRPRTQGGDGGAGNEPRTAADTHFKPDPKR